MSKLSPDFKVIAVDSYGSRQTPDWHFDRVISLLDEVELLAPVLEQIDEQFILVGHSYGGAIALDIGDSSLAAQHYIDLWMGQGSWAKTPDERKPAVATSVRNVRRWGHALFSEPTTLEAFKRINVPVLCMVGGKSQLSAHSVVDRLVATLPQVERIDFPEMGHMGPVTHADGVNDAISRFVKTLI